MALVPYHHHAPTHISHHSSRDSRARSSTHRPSTSTSNSTRYTPSRSTSSSSASSSESSYTRVSTQTFGSRSRRGYAPGQAPHDYFYNEEVREEWDSAPVDAYGRRVRESRVRGRGSGWTAHGAASQVSSFEDGSPKTSSGHLHYRQPEDGGWDNDTVSPADSISQVSSKPRTFSSRKSDMGRTGPAREQYAPSGYSRRSSRAEDDYGMMGISSHGRRRSDTVSMANGRLVRIEEPDW